MLRNSSEYREISQLAHMVMGITKKEVPALTLSDLVDIKEIEAAIDHNSKMGLYQYMHHRPFSVAVQNYILHFGFSIHGTSPAEGEGQFSSVSW